MSGALNICRTTAEWVFPGNWLKTGLWSPMGRKTADPQGSECHHANQHQGSKRGAAKQVCP